jgi:hypothetical protein
MVRPHEAQVLGAGVTPTTLETVVAGRGVVASSGVVLGCRVGVLRCQLGPAAGEILVGFLVGFRVSGGLLAAIAALGLFVVFATLSALRFARL